MKGSKVADHVGFSIRLCSGPPAKYTYSAAGRYRFAVDLR